MPEHRVWELIFELGFLVGEQSSRPAHHAIRRLGLGRLGWGMHVLLGRRTTWIAQGRGYGDEGVVRLLKEYVAGEE